MNLSAIYGNSAAEIDPQYNRRPLILMNNDQLNEKREALRNEIDSKISKINERILNHIPEIAFEEIKHVYKSIVLLREVEKIVQHFTEQTDLNVLSTKSFSMCFTVIAIIQFFDTIVIGQSVLDFDNIGEWVFNSVLTSVIFWISTAISSVPFLCNPQGSNLIHTEDKRTNIYSNSDIKQFFRLLNRLSHFEDFEPEAKENLLRQIMDVYEKLMDEQKQKLAPKEIWINAFKKLREKYSLNNLQNFIFKPISSPIKINALNMLSFLPFNFDPFKTQTVQQIELRHLLTSSLQHHNPQWSMIVENIKRLNHIQSDMINSQDIARKSFKSLFLGTFIATLAPASEAIYQNVAPNVQGPNIDLFITRLSNVAWVIFGVGTFISAQACWTFLAAKKFDKSSSHIEMRPLLIFAKQMAKLTDNNRLSFQGKEKAFFKATLAYHFLSPEYKTIIPRPQSPKDIISELSQIPSSIDSEKQLRNLFCMQREAFNTNYLLKSSEELNLLRENYAETIKQKLTLWKSSFANNNEASNKLPFLEIEHLRLLLGGLQTMEFILDSRKNQNKRGIYSSIKQNGTSAFIFVMNLAINILGQYEAKKYISSEEYSIQTSSSQYQQDLFDIDNLINNSLKFMALSASLFGIILLGDATSSTKGKTTSYAYESFEFKQFINLIHLICHMDKLSAEGQQKTMENILIAFDRIPKELREGELPFGKDIEIAMRKMLKGEEMV